MELKRYRNKAEMRNLKNPTPLQNDAGLQHHALASLVHFVIYTAKLTRDSSALLHNKAY